MSSMQRLNEIISAMISGMKPGQRLPSEPKLAKQLCVSRATLREAMRAFETQGVIFRRQGSGTYVVQPPAVIETGLEVLESIETLAARIGLDVSMGELKLVERKADEKEANELNISPEDEVLHVSRAILAHGKAVAYLVDILPKGVISETDLQKNFRGSVLDLLLRRGKLALQSSRCEISAVQANSELAKIFGIQRGDALLLFTAWLFTATGEVVDFSYSYFLPGYYRFHVIRRVGQ